MDNREKPEILRHKLAGMISAAVELCDEGECCESCKYSHSTACTDYLIADYMIAHGVTVGGVAELISSSKIGLDWYTRIPIYYCSHCGWYIESRSKPPERPRDLDFCPKCGFMFLPQKEVDDVSS